MNQAGVFSEKLSKVQIRAGRGPAIRIAATSFLLFVYLAFVVFAAWDPGGWAPNDYAVFMRIGRALLAGEPVYTENSYYPLPYVAIFSPSCRDRFPWPSGSWRRSSWPWS